jgi:hypothetical protein
VEVRFAQEIVVRCKERCGIKHLPSLSYLVPFVLRMLLSRCCAWLLACLLALPTRAQTTPTSTALLDLVDVDTIVARTLKTFDVPGLEVAMTKDEI